MFLCLSVSLSLKIDKDISSGEDLKKRLRFCQSVKLLSDVDIAGS